VDKDLSAFAALLKRLRLRLIAAPMFRVSGVDLMIAACRIWCDRGFPTVNCRTVEELDVWLSAIRAAATRRRGAAI
jgi:nitronate monooxygenase